MNPAGCLNFRWSSLSRFALLFSNVPSPKLNHRLHQISKTGCHIMNTMMMKTFLFLHYSTSALPPKPWERLLRRFFFKMHKSHGKYVVGQASLLHPLKMQFWRRLAHSLQTSRRSGSNSRPDGWIGMGRALRLIVIPS